MKTTESPWIRAVTLNPPTLQDNTADADRLISVLKAALQTDAIHIDLDLLKTLPLIGPIPEQILKLRSVKP